MRCHKGESEATRADRLAPARRPSGTSVFLSTWHVRVRVISRQVRKSPGGDLTVSYHLNPFPSTMEGTTKSSGLVIHVIVDLG